MPTLNSHIRCALTASVLLFGALNGCASQHDRARSEFARDGGFVRIESIEAGAPVNDHPASIPADALRAMLEDLRVKGTSIEPASVFDTDELQGFVPPMANALSKAGPRQDVTFAVAGKRGLLGRFSGTTFTTGRLFVSDNQINVIFGQMHERYDNRDGTTPSDPPFEIGLRERRIEGTWRLETTGTCVRQRRADWIVAGVRCISEAASATSSTPTATKPTGTGDENRLRELEGRLRLLDRLKERGVVTEEEYRERRKAILEGI